MTRPAPGATPILFIDHAPALGGAERSLLLLLEHLDRRRWEPHVAGVPGPLLEAAHQLGAGSHAVDLPRLRRSRGAPFAWRRAGREIAGLAANVQARLLHANTVRAAFLAAPAARRAGIPLVWHMRDFWLSEGAPALPWLDSLGKRWLCSRAARVVVNSEAVRRASGAFRSSRVRVIHNGLDLGRYDPARDGALFRALHGFDIGAPLVGTIGRLRPWKGQDRFLRAMRSVARERPDARFVVAGGAILADAGGYRSSLQRQAMVPGLEGRVRFTGHLDDVRDALAALDVLVHAGDPEPFGLVVLEAMAMEVPVVAFRHGGLPEVLDRSGLLVPPEDENGLAGAVLALLADPARRASLGREGRRRVADRFRIERTAAAIETLYDEILSGRAHRH